MLDGELPPSEVALEGEIGQSHGGMMRDRSTRDSFVARAILAAMARTIVIAGSPTALGGHFGGMERSPAELRGAGLARRLSEDPAFDGVTWHDAGDAPNEPGWLPDPDPRAKNREAIVAYLPRLTEHVATALDGTAGDADARLLVLGGDCTSHVGALAGLRRARPDTRFGLVWFDAHGDFNTPDTTPSGNVWGMPFAMLCGRGDPDLVGSRGRRVGARGGRGPRRRAGPRRDGVADARGQRGRPLWRRDDRDRRRPRGAGRVVRDGRDPHRRLVRRLRP